VVEIAAHPATFFALPLRAAVRRASEHRGGGRLVPGGKRRAVSRSAAARTAHAGNLAKRTWRSRSNRGGEVDLFQRGGERIPSRA